VVQRLLPRPVFLLQELSLVEILRCNSFRLVYVAVLLLLQRFDSLCLIGCVIASVIRLIRMTDLVLRRRISQGLLFVIQLLLELLKLIVHSIVFLLLGVLPPIFHRLQVSLNLSS